MAPVIGITSYYLSRQELAGRAWIRGVAGHDAQYLPTTYTRAVWKAGGLPWILPVQEDPILIRRLLRRLDGLVFAGGEDLTPGFQGAPCPPDPQRTVLHRDRWESALWDALQETGLPVLGVCRGLQVVNFFAGGTLVADIPSQVQGSSILHRGHGIPGTHPSHPVRVEPGSRLWTLARSEEWQVNSFHHQAVEEPAPGLRVTARAPDGIIEALEGRLSGPFLGIQWHPEALQDGPAAHWIHPFRWLVEEARRRG